MSSKPSSLALTSYQYRLLAVLALINFVNFADRQAIPPLVPLIRDEFGLTSTQISYLQVALQAVLALSSIPFGFFADRFNRSRIIAGGVIFWSFATIFTSHVHTFAMLLLARAFVGIGEAAYGSVGIAVVLSIFPARLRSTLTAAFMAGGAFGSVLGMALGGTVAAHLGWRAAFGAMAALGIVLLILYRFAVTEKQLARLQPASVSRQAQGHGVRMSFRTLMKGLFSTKSVVCAYVGSGIHLLVPAAVWAWMPSFLNRYYGMSTGKAAMSAAVFVLATAFGMVVCGVLTDRLSKHERERKWSTAVAFCLICFVLLTIGFRMPAGPAQLVVIGAGMFFSAGATGPSGAMVANLTPPSIHASAFATLTLANNLLGLAPAAVLTGIVADRIGLLGALQLVPFAPLVAAIAFFIGKRNYGVDLDRLSALREQAGG